MTMLYVLKDRTPVPEQDTLTWALWFEDADRTVSKTQVNEDVCVSTVFLGLDHNHGLTGRPVLFETMVFGGELDEEMRRYSTWNEAEEGHAYVVKLAQLAEGIEP